jgi:uncharacterized Tic20 family protein
MTDNPQDPSAQSDQPPQPYVAQPPPAQPYAAAPPPPPMAGQAQGYSRQGLAPVSPSDARMWSMLTHIGGIFFGFIPGLVVYLVYKDRDPFIRRHAAQALNFQIIIAIGYIVSSILIFVVIGLFTGFLIWVASIVFSIMAAMAANKGEEYTYPLTPTMVT